MAIDLRATATQLGGEIAAGQVDPVELTQAYLDAIAAHEHGADIYARTMPERALAEAEAARIRAQNGVRLSRFDGVPMSWKDLFDTAGVATEAGSGLLAGRIPTKDAETLTQASLAGYVTLGKTHLSELAFSGLGYNPKTATPPNINDPDAVPGGSSSGAAASVAHGLAAAAMGSDTGGSIRIPAAWNDLVGFKPSKGKLSSVGTVPLCPSFDTMGPLTRNVADAAEIYMQLSADGSIDLEGVDLTRVHLAVLRGAAFDDMRAEPLEGFDTALARLADAGANITELSLDVVSEALTLSPTLYAPEAYGVWKEVIEAQPEVMYEEILTRFRGARQVSAHEFVAGWQKLYALRSVFLSQIASVDAVLCPTAPILPPNRARLIRDRDYYTTENLLALRNTRIGNLMDLCGITLPTGVPSAGIMMMAPAGCERKLLRIAFRAETALGH